MNFKICNSQNNFIRKGRKVCTICENKQRKDRYYKNRDNELSRRREDLISWKNLFPMEKEENSKKNNKIIDSIIIYREQQLIKYLKNNE